MAEAVKMKKMFIRNVIYLRAYTASQPGASSSIIFERGVQNK
jgi:hypothetical protein